jgi:hypothetical protein
MGCCAQSALRLFHAHHDQVGAERESDFHDFFRFRTMLNTELRLSPKVDARRHQGLQSAKG